MSLSKFFIRRPIFAAALSVVIFLAGAISIFRLPISEYPEIAPPSVAVSASFPGANAKTLAETVAAPLEEQISGTEGMIYMNSQSAGDGRVSLTATFEIGTDPDLAQQLIQNRVSQALPRLPDITRQIGVTTVKTSPDLTMVVHLTSKDGRYDSLYLRNYALINVKDQLAKIKGVGQVELFGGGDYAMRLWLNPDKMTERKLTASDIVNAVRGQNIQAAGGIIGGAPYGDNAEVQLAINVKGRLETPEEFADIIIRSDENGRVTRISDVARVELGSSEYALRSLLDNKEAVALPIFASPGANALDISANVRKTMAELQNSFPESVEYSVIYDPTVFVRGSINAVIMTLLEAVALVALVVILFLQRWRAAIIPLLAVPVSVTGTFAVMLLLGFSINVLSLFGLILAIGIVVDDAIIVVENVERNIEEGLEPHEATDKAMNEVTGPIIATTLVLLAVFIPIAFISGLTGQFYRQFALTIAISTVISAFNSLTLSPAMSALLLQSADAPKDVITRGTDFLLGGFFKGFNKVFKKSATGYSRGVQGFIKRKSLSLGLYAVLLFCTYGVFQITPSGFVPAQDKQYLIGFTQLPEGATLDRTDKVIREMSDIALKTPGVEGAVAFPGLSINGFTNSSSAGIVFLTLDGFEKRTTPELSGFAIAQTLQEKFNAVDEAFIAIFPPPPVNGLGTAGGFKLQIEDRKNEGYAALNEALNKVVDKARQSPELLGIFSNYKINVPQLYVEPDRTKILQSGLNVSDVFATMQLYLGSLYINDFNKFGRIYQVIAQADQEFRNTADDIVKLNIRNDKGEMIPLGSVLTVTETFGPESAQRYNAFLSADVNGAPAPGYSSGQAQDAITKILHETLPEGMAFEWTELTYQQILAGDTMIYVIPLALFLVFLVLAAQYESLFMPAAILLIVPTGMFAALFGVWISGGDNNIFTQISLFVLMGLATKNSILIVEFARELEHQGRGIVEAAIEAAQLRLRPILMTSLAFIMGVAPLVVAKGTGAEMQKALGIAVFSGMIGVTIFGLFLTPVFYVLLRKIQTRGKETSQGSAV